MKIDNMTDEEKQAKIAEARGFTVRFNESKGLHELITPNGKWEHPYDADGDEAHCWSYAPDYLNNLELMHEAEESLDSSQSKDFADHLERITPKHQESLWKFYFAHASARQRADAFLLALP